MRQWLLVLGFVFACEPSLPRPEDPTPLDRLVLGELEGDAVPGLQAAVIRGDEVTVHAWGLADTETRRLVDESTLFTIASVSKLITTVAVMQQVESGTLDLDDAIDVGFPVMHPVSGDRVTLRQLLSHTSGMVDNWDVLEPLYVPTDSDIALRDFVEGYLTRGGAWYDDDNWGSASQFEYSNIGIALAAVVVEHVTEQDFEAYCRSEIFEPLGMTDTSWFLRGVDLSRLAVPTTWRREWKPQGHYGWPDYPNGTLRTSADQLARFLLAVTDRDAGFLEPETVDEMLRVQNPELDDTQALGFFWWTLDDESVVGHDGGDVGIATEAFLRPDHDDGVIILTNGDLSSSAFRRIQRALLEDG